MRKRSLGKEAHGASRVGGLHLAPSIRHAWARPESLIQWCGGDVCVLEPGASCDSLASLAPPFPWACR